MGSGEHLSTLTAAGEISPDAKKEGWTSGVISLTPDFSQVYEATEWSGEPALGYWTQHLVKQGANGKGI